MQSWELFQLFPTGSIDKIAARLHRSRTLIEKWFRRPDSDEAPTGDPNPIDRLEAIFEVAQFICPEFQVALVDYFLTKLEDGNRATARELQDRRTRLHAVESGKRRKVG